MQGNRSMTFCSKCGSKNYTTSTFCSGCGNKIKDSILSNGSNIDYLRNDLNNNIDNNRNKNINNNIVDTSYTSDDINKFVGPNMDYYNIKFNQIKSTGKKITWNWPAFLFNMYWMLYRKMYAKSIIISLISSILFLALPDGLNSIASIAITIGIGLYGNYMYLNHMEKKITDINHYDSNLREVMIRKKGGTNIVLPILIIILPIIVVILMMLVLFGSMLIYGL